MPHSFFTPYPKYLQIRELLLRRLIREFAPGDRLPTENELSAEFGVARETVREALSGLEEDGLIVRRRRNGTFVAKRPAERARRLTGLSEDFSELKFDTVAKVLEAKAVAPPGSLVELMKLKPLDKIFHIRRLRSFENEPFSYEEAFLPPDIGRQVARFDLRHAAIIHVLRNRMRLQIWEDHQQVEAVAADPHVAGLLAVAVGAPLLFMMRHFRDESDKSVAAFWSHLRPDRYYYTLKLERPRSLRRPKASRPRAARIT